ncbi:hypothetical protein GGR88_000619 [Sphingomonas jejuensis]|uniref:TniB protein n=1 Tax=Sphingomonas jejuensis TaxID=904715 RepID=A0ABX0XIT1_9SPHN|nr:TniB family NTP-binding protein [Sphingomonas jejuensis]NJC33145.1 hypothetical protein [Sphingomonas jejuensis]
MSDTYDNPTLRPEMQEFLDIEGRGRLGECWNRVWVPTPSTKEAFIELQDCMNAAQSTKPRGLIITGEADTGKSRTMQAFRDLHQPRMDPESEYAEHRVIYLTAPDNPDPVVVLKKILAELGHPLRYNPSPADLRSHAVTMLKACRVGTVMIDEIHDISRDSRMNSKIVSFLVFMKSLINDTGRPFVVGGTQVVLDMIASEDQIAGRLNTVIKLKPFTLSEFAMILLAFERMLPLRRQSRFRENEGLVQLAYTLTQGYIGRLNYLLEDACKVAIDSGEERITLSTIDRVRDRSIVSVGRRVA